MAVRFACSDRRNAFSSRAWTAAALACSLMIVALRPPLRAADWPVFGRDATRNSVSPEKNPPTDWDVATGRNIKWKAEIASAAFGSPVIADGLVWIGGNRLRAEPKNRFQPDPNQPEQDDAALLLCFDEQTGEKLYEYVSPRLRSGISNDPDWHGLGSVPLIEGNRLWFVTNRCEVVCLDIAALKATPRGSPQIVWRVDLRERFGVHPHQPYMGPSRLCSIAPSYQGLIYVSTANGVDSSYVTVPAPNAPGLICFDHDTGEAQWQVRTSENLLQSEIASPLVAEIGGRGQVVMPHGDGWVRSYDPHTGQLLWECDSNSKDAVYSRVRPGKRNYFLSTPVLHEDRLYIANGHEPEQGGGDGRLLCIDPTRSGDISAELAIDKDGNVVPPRRIRNIDPAAGERAIPNPNSGVVWVFADRHANDRWDHGMHRALANVVIHNGQLFIPDFDGVLHCLDTRSGQPHWHYDLLAMAWATPLVVDDTLFVVSDDGNVRIFNISASSLSNEVAEQKEPPEPIAEIEVDSVYLVVPPVFANGVLYVTTRSTLYAIQRSSAESARSP